MNGRNGLTDPVIADQILKIEEKVIIKGDATLLKLFEKQSVTSCKLLAAVHYRFFRRVKIYYYFIILFFIFLYAAFPIFLYILSESDLLAILIFHKTLYSFNTSGVSF